MRIQPMINEIHIPYKKGVHLSRKNVVNFFQFCVHTVTSTDWLPRLHLMMFFRKNRQENPNAIRGNPPVGLNRGRVHREENVGLDYRWHREIPAPPGTRFPAQKVGTIGRRVDYFFLHKQCWGSAFSFNADPNSDPGFRWAKIENKLQLKLFALSL